ncbi:MAG: proline dehydrogenase family protein [Myxococcales bacterium]|nr:MAG: proline dehydrogenase family protein [Myxococcales bacterium]
MVLFYSTAPARREAELEEAIASLAELLWRASAHSFPGAGKASALQDHLMQWAMKDPAFKTDLFRFVDVLPSLQTPQMLSEHLREYLLSDGRSAPWAIDKLLRLASKESVSSVSIGQIRKQVQGMAKRFIAGTNLQDARKTLSVLAEKGLLSTLDLLGEMAVSEKEAEQYQASYLVLLEELRVQAAAWPFQEGLLRNHKTILPAAQLSLKLSTLYSQFDPAAMKESVERCYERLAVVAAKAREYDIGLNIDIEQFDKHEFAFQVFEKIAKDPAFCDWPHLGIVVQAYLRTSEQDVERLLSLVKGRGAPVGVRLVKGAYWDYETLLAEQRDWPCPVFGSKEHTDANYEKLTRLLLESNEWLWPAFASHNLRSLAHAMCVAEAMALPKESYELQMLYGMAGGECQELIKRGHRVRLYVPVGELIAGMAYLVRRLLENTSNEGFLKQTKENAESLKKLLTKPTAENQPMPSSSKMVFDDVTGSFSNCPLSDFSKAETRDAFMRALEQEKKTFPCEVPICVGGEKLLSQKQVVKRYCPSDHSLHVATVHYATADDVNRALDIAQSHTARWRTTSVEHRAKLLLDLARLMNERRYRLAARICFEIGKPWHEADADVAEGIDFCGYYARMAMQELAPRRITSPPGEDNTLKYEGRGVAVVIAPWNFPLAILCGMSTAALVAGNTLIMKAAEQSSAVGYALLELMHEAGFPTGVVQFLPGLGQDLGPALVSDRRVSTIAFTGSREVGVAIAGQASKIQAGQHQLKRVVCEMGGKNAIIVDDDADLDEAVLGVVHSAFDFAGQKCSACSRVIVLNGIYDLFVERLREAVRSLVWARRTSRFIVWVL